MKILLVFVALFAGVPLHAQEAGSSEMLPLTLVTASQAKDTAGRMNEERLKLDSQEVELAALSEAVQAMKTAKGSEQQITALESLLESRTDDFKAAKSEYLKKDSETRDVSILQNPDADPLTFVISPGQATEAYVVIHGDGVPRLRITLTHKHTDEFADFTKRNLGKEVNLVVNGAVLSQATIRDTIQSSSLELSVASVEAGVALAKALTAR